MEHPDVRSPELFPRRRRGGMPSPPLALRRDGSVVANRLSGSFRAVGGAALEQGRLMLGAEPGGERARRQRGREKSAAQRAVVGASSLLYLLPAAAYWRAGDACGAALFAAVTVCSVAADADLAPPAHTHGGRRARQCDRWTASAGGVYAVLPALLPTAGVGVAAGAAAAAGVSVSFLLAGRGCESTSAWVLWQSLWHLVSALAVAAGPCVCLSLGLALPSQWAAA